MKRISSNPLEFDSTNQTSINNVLQPEILIHIFSFLNHLDYTNCSFVNKWWNERPLTIIKIESLPIQNYATFLISKLNSNVYKNEINQLFSIQNEKKFLNLIKLSSLRTSHEDVSTIFIKILKNLNENDLDELEKLSSNEERPLGFENLFEVAKDYKEFDRSLKELTTYYLAHNRAVRTNLITAPCKICVKLIYDGSHSKICQELIRELNPEITVLICSTLVCIMNLPVEALWVAKLIPDYASKKRAFSTIFEPLLKQTKIDEVLEDIREIHAENIETQYTFFARVYKFLVDAKNHMKAEEVLNLIPNHLQAQFVKQAKEFYEKS